MASILLDSGHVTSIRVFPRHGRQSSRAIIRCKMSKHVDKLCKTLNRQNILKQVENVKKWKSKRRCKNVFEHSNNNENNEQTARLEASGLDQRCTQFYRAVSVDQTEAETTLELSKQKLDDRLEEESTSSTERNGDDLSAFSDDLESDSAVCEKSEPAYRTDVFISCSEENRQEAQEIQDMIRTCGLSCIFEDDLDPGPILEQVESAIQSSRRMIWLLSKTYMENEYCRFEMHMSYFLMYERQNVMVIPVLLDLTETWVVSRQPRLYHLQFMNRHDVHFHQQLLSILRGPDILVRDLFPVGNIAPGLVYNYILRYLKPILPDVPQRIEDWCKGKQCKDVRMPRKLYILVPASCKCPPKLSSVDARIEDSGHLKTVSMDSAGSVGRKYDLTVWTIHRDKGENWQFVAEYPAIIDTLYLIENERNLGLGTHLRQKERSCFVQMLRDILKTYRLECYAQIVEYHDTDEKGQNIPLSDILTTYMEGDRLPASPSPPTSTLPLSLGLVDSDSAH